MKRLIYVVVFIVLLIPTYVNAAITNSSSLSDINVYVIYDDDCKNCNKEIEWLEDLNSEYPRMILSKLDKVEDKDLVKRVKETLKIKNDKLPLTIIGSNYFIGYSNNKKDDIKSAIDAYLEYDNHCDLIIRLKNDEDIDTCLKENKDIYIQEDNKLLIIIPIIIVVLVVASIVGIFIFKNKKIKD